MVRALHQSVTRAWSIALTAIERQSWRTFAGTHPTLNRIGNTQLLSGFSFFVSLNLRLITAGGTFITTPPASLVVTAPTGAAPTAPGGAIKSFTSGPALAANEVVKTDYTAALPPGIQYVSDRFYTIKYIAGINTLHTDTFEWQAQFGTLPSGSGLQIWQRSSIVNTVTGAQSGYVIGAVII
jgi:hypothetical protein